MNLAVSAVDPVLITITVALAGTGAGAGAVVKGRAISAHANKSAVTEQEVESLTRTVLKICACNCC